MTVALTKLRMFSQIRRQFTTVTQDNGVRRIILNNPKTRNALSLKTISKLQQDLTSGDNDSLRCVVISGEGPAFSAGHDLKELTSKTGSEYHRKVFSACTDLMTKIRNLPVPVIAQVRGVAAAAGCQLVASCDIVIASNKARFSVPGANVGLFCSTPGIAISRAVPKKVAAYMLFTADPISAEEALRCGLVSKIAPEDQLETETSKITDAICNKSRPVVALGKEFLYQQVEMDVSSAYRNGEKVMVNNLRLADTQEGIKSFIEKRKPNWTHRDDKVN